jgi:hypothetical protein
VIFRETLGVALSVDLCLNASNIWPAYNKLIKATPIETLILARHSIRQKNSSPKCVSYSTLSIFHSPNPNRYFNFPFPHTMTPRLSYCSYLSFLYFSPFLFIYLFFSFLLSIFPFSIFLFISTSIYSLPHLSSLSAFSAGKKGVSAWPAAPLSSSPSRHHWRPSSPSARPLP